VRERETERECEREKEVGKRKHPKPEKPHSAKARQVPENRCPNDSDNFI